MKATTKLVLGFALGVALNGVQITADVPVRNTAPSDQPSMPNVAANQTPPDSSPPPQSDSAPAVDPLQAELVAQIVTLKNSLTTATSPEEVAAIMAKMDELNKQLSVLQGSGPPPANPPPPPKPDPSPTIDPAQADLIAQIIQLKDAMVVVTSPEEIAAIMAKMDELNKQLSVLQGSGPPPADPPPLPKSDPSPTIDPAQADLIAQIIQLKDSLTTTSAPEEVAVIMGKIDDLNQQLIALQGAAQPPTIPPQPIKTDPALSVNPLNAAIAGKSSSNKLLIASNRNSQNNNNAHGKFVTITWDGGPGLILQMSQSVKGAEWNDVPNTEGKSSIDLPMTNNGTFLRVIKR